MNEWVYKPLGDPDYFQVIMGQSPPSSEYNDDGQGLPFYRGKADFGLIHPTPRKYCTEPTRVAKKDDILISVRAPVGPTNLANEKCSIGRGLAAIRCKHGILPKFLLYALRAIENKIADSVRDQGGGFTSIKRDQLKAFELPTPDINEQRRIVARIEELTRCAEQARKLAAERESELDTLLQALYSRMIERAKWKPIEDVASLVRRAVKTKPDGRYEEMGIRSFGKGTFKKPVLTGKQVGNKRIYTIYEGDLVFNNVFAWEKAIAVAKAEDHARVGSHRFITYVPHKGHATSEFLCHHFLGERGIEAIRAASPGSAGRNRTLGLKKLEKILVPVPGYIEQKKFAEIAKRRQIIQLKTAGIEKEIVAFSCALLSKAFRGEL
jgi:restriction endonuclease S subunit